MEAKNYDGTTTTITASGEPIIIPPRCNDMGFWKMSLDLDYGILGREITDQFITGVDAANTIFDLPNSHQSLMYFHAAAGFQQRKHLWMQSEPATTRCGRDSLPP